MEMMENALCWNVTIVALPPAQLDDVICWHIGSH